MRQPLAVHRAIMVVDVERFGDPARTNLNQLAIREALYTALTEAFAQSGIGWDSCVSEDRGDGARILIPPEVPKTHLVTGLPGLFAAAVTRHNRGSSVPERMRVRVALHAGEVYRDAHGVAGAAVNHAFRLAEAPAVRSVLAASPGVLALIVSDWFFTEVVRHDPTAVPGSYRRAEVFVKETATTGWIRVPDPAAAPARAEPGEVPGQDGTAITVRGRIWPAARSLAGPVLRLAPRPTVLAGREELLAGLDARLANGEGSGPRVVALCGLGGAGKTSVAVEYAHRHMDQVGVAWQLPAEDATMLAAGFTVLADQLGTSAAAGGGDPVAAVHSALAAYPGQWLLIFDNAPGQDPVRAFVPPAGNGQVLITSQSAVWPPGQAVEVSVLDTETGAALLADQTDGSDAQAAAALAKELGGLPLALAQAAAYTHAAGIGLAEYRSLFQGRRADLLARGETPGHPADVAATLGLALSRLEADAPAAAALLRLLACLAPEPVPLALILMLSDKDAPQDKPSTGSARRPGHCPDSNIQSLTYSAAAPKRIADVLAPDAAAMVGPVLGDPVAAGDAVAALRRYSLVTPADGRMVLVHRLVQAITRDQAPADVVGQWEQAAAALVEAATPKDTWLPATWPDCAVLLPHARAVLDLTSHGMWWIAQYLGSSGSYQPARDLFQLIVDAHNEDDAYGPEHQDTLIARATLAYWTGQAGDAAGARNQYAALLPTEERILGPEHPETLTTRANHARYTGEAGDAALARDMLAALLPLRERVSGPEHPDTLADRSNLARWTGNAGDAAGARDMFAVLLPIRERVSGPDHLDTLADRGNLADFTGQAGDAAGARDMLAALLPLRERVSGPEHPDTLADRSNLARWTGNAGDAARARDMFAVLLPIAERVLGPEHPRTLALRDDLTYWTTMAEGEADSCVQAQLRAPRASGGGCPAIMT